MVNGNCLARLEVSTLMAEKLAILGGSKIRVETFPPNMPYYTSHITEITSLINKVLNENITMFGKSLVKNFEEKFKNFLRVKHAIMMSSGTAALHAALLAINVERGDEVILPAIDYVAPLNSILLQKGTPVFCDILLTNFTIDPNCVKNAISTKTKAIIAIHLFGFMSDIISLNKIAKDNNIALIEDAAHALGAKREGIPAGASGIGVFSFSGGKIITSGEGGMVTVNDDEIANKIRLVRHEGESWHEFPGLSSSEVIVKYFNDYIKGRELNTIGHNFRPTALQAAMLIPQLDDLKENLNIREKIAKIYINELSKIPEIIVPKINNNEYPSFNRFVILINNKLLNISRDYFVLSLVAEGIPAGVYSPIPLHEHKYINNLTQKIIINKLTNSLYFSKNNIQIPIFATMEENDAYDVVNAIIKIINYIKENPQKVKDIINISKKVILKKYDGEYIYDIIF